VLDAALAHIDVDEAVEALVEGGEVWCGGGPRAAPVISRQWRRTDGLAAG
jgi:hypothetical protein